MALLVLYRQHFSLYLLFPLPSRYLPTIFQGFPSSPGEHRNSLPRKCYTKVTIAYLLVNYFHVYQDLNCVLGTSIIIQIFFNYLY